MFSKLNYKAMVTVIGENKFEDCIFHGHMKTLILSP
jgi:hypothetical protein